MNTYIVRANLTEIAIVYNCESHSEAINTALNKLYNENYDLWLKFSDYEWLAEKIYYRKNVVELLI